jgi:hypothetical protein
MRSSALKQEEYKNSLLIVLLKDADFTFDNIYIGFALCRVNR